MHKSVLSFFFLISQLKHMFVGTPKNHHNETSFEHPKQMFKLMDSKIFPIYSQKICNMYLIQRKPVFGIWDKSMLKPVYSYTEPS